MTLGTTPDTRRARIAGVYEHPARELPDTSTEQLHAEVALGALEDAGLSMADVDAYFCAGDAPGFGALSMSEYLGLRPSYMDTTEGGGASYLSHVGHAAAAIAAGKCDVALVTMGGRPRSGGPQPGESMLADAPEGDFERLLGLTVPASYALAARRHMYEYGTTSEDLAEIRVAASLHAQHNQFAVRRTPVSVEDVLASPLVADPLHVLDCCLITDGGGALVLVRPEVARELRRPCVTVLGHGEAVRHTDGGRVDLTRTAADESGARAFREAGVTPDDIDYASIYDSFTITVLLSLEDLGFCAKGEGGRFVRDGALVSPHGRLPINTDGGGLCNNHPGNRGGMTKVIEAVRQLRGEAHPAVQVPDCALAVAHGTGGSLGTRIANATLVLGRDGE